MGDVNPHIIAPDPFESDDCLNDFPPAHLSSLTNTENPDTMSAGDDEPPSGLNGRLRPRKSNVIKPDIPKAVRKDARLSVDKPKKSSTPSKASPNKHDDLVEKSDLSLSTQFLCALCDKKFASRQTVLKHARRMHQPDPKRDTFVGCLFCDHSEPSSGDIVRHMTDNHPDQYFTCLDCHSRFSSSSELSEHKLTACDKQNVSYRNKLRQKIPGNKKKKTQNDNKDDIPGEHKEFQEGYDFNGIVISCELKPSQVRNEDDIEDNITTNLILPPSKGLPNNSTLDKNAVIVLDDLQWNKRVPSNFSFHNTDTDQILSRLGVVHRSPRNAEPTKREWLKLIDASTQKFERCFDTSFYTKVASNVQENLAKFLDGSCKFNPDPENIINTRKSKNSVVINTAEGFPILLASEQFSRNVFDGYLPRAIAPKHKWKWDNNDADKIQLNPDQIKRDFHTNKCIITLISSLDIWSQLRMRRKYEEKYNSQHIEEKTEKQNVIGRELKEILESREIPTSSQLVKYKHNPPMKPDGLEFPSSLGLAPIVPKHEVKPAVLSGEWVRPRCFVCCACGAQTRDPRGLSSHMNTQHPNAKVQHYEIVGDSLLNSDILKHLYVPPSQVANRTRPLRGVRDCTKCKKPITLEDLHQHMLDCAGDTPAVRRRQCRYRPFGVRKRRPRLPDNTVRKKIRSDIRDRQRRQKNHIRTRPRIRTEVGDAETIRKMLADLPAKRHRVLVNPSNQMTRPRRILERQRNKIMMKKAKSLDSKTRDMTANKDSAGYNESSNNDEPGDNSSDDDNKKVSRPLRPQATRVRPMRSTRLNQVLKRKAAMNQAKKRSLRLKEQKNSSEFIEKPATQPNTSMIDTEKFSDNDQPKRIDVKGCSYNTKEHANQGGSNNQEQQRPENNESNANNNNAQPPTQNVPLKHSIARLTAETERHDKSVQFNHVFLVQQECNNSGEHNMPSGQQMLFENEPALTRLDKPPLDCHQKGSIDLLNQKNNKQKPRKGLNDCIAMLKNKLTDPVSCASVMCGNDDPIDLNVPVMLPLPNLNFSIGTELKQNEPTPKIPEENISSVLLPKQYVPNRSEAVQANFDVTPKIQLPKEGAKRKYHRSRSFTHQDLFIADNIPIQLNPEVVIIPRKSSDSRSFVSPPPVSNKLRSRRDSVPQPSPTNVGATINKFYPEVCRPGNQPILTPVLPEIDLIWKNPFDNKPHKKGSMKPPAVRSRSGNNNVSMTPVSSKTSEIAGRSGNYNVSMTSISPKPSEFAGRSGNNNVSMTPVSPKPSEIAGRSGNYNVSMTSVSPKPSKNASRSGNNNVSMTSVSPKPSENAGRSGNNNVSMTSVSPKPSEIVNRSGRNYPLMSSVGPKPAEVPSRSRNTNLLKTSVSPKPSEIGSLSGNNNRLKTSVSPKSSEISSRSRNNYPLMTSVSPKPAEVPSRSRNTNLLKTSVSPKPSEIGSLSGNNYPLMTSVSPKPAEVPSRSRNTNLLKTSVSPKPSEIGSLSGNNYPSMTSVSPKPAEVPSRSRNTNLLKTSVSPKPSEIGSLSGNNYPLMTSVSPKPAEVPSRSRNTNLLKTSVSPKPSEIGSLSGNNYPLMTSVSPKPAEVPSRSRNTNLLKTSVSPKPSEIGSLSGNNNRLKTSVSPKSSEISNRSGHNYPLMTSVSPKPAEVLSRSGNTNLLKTSVSPKPEFATCSGNNLPSMTSISPKPLEVLTRSGNNLLMTSLNPKSSEIASSGNNYPLMTSVSPKSSEVLSRSGNNNLLLTSVSPKPSEIASPPGDNYPLKTSVSPKRSEVLSRSGNDNVLMTTASPKPSEVASRSANNNILMTSVSPKPLEVLHHVGNNSMLMTTSQMINPDILAYESQVNMRPENLNYSNLNLDNCPPDIQLDHTDMDKEDFIAAPLDLSAKIMTESPYSACNYDCYGTLDLSNKKIESIVDLRVKQLQPPASIQYSIGEYVYQPTHLSIQTGETDTFVDISPKINEDTPYVPDLSSKRYKREEPLRLFINENTDIRSLPVSCEKSLRNLPATECSINANIDHISDKTGAVNYASHYMNKISEYEHLSKLRAASIDEKRSMRSKNYTNVLLQNEKDYQLRAANEIMYLHNQQVEFDPVRYKVDLRNKPATVTSATYAAPILTQHDMINNINISPSHVIPHGNHFSESVFSEKDIYKNKCDEAMITPLSSQFMGSQPSLPKPHNLEYKNNHPVQFAEDTLRFMPRVTDNSRTKSDIPSVADFENSTSSDLNSTLRKERALNNEIDPLKEIKSQKITLDDKINSDTVCTTPKETLSVQPGSMDNIQTHSIQSVSPKTLRRRLSEYDNTSRDLSTPVTDLSTKAKSTNQNIQTHSIQSVSPKTPRRHLSEYDNTSRDLSTPVTDLSTKAKSTNQNIQTHSIQSVSPKTPRRHLSEYDNTSRDLSTPVTDLSTKAKSTNQNIQTHSIQSVSPKTPRRHLSEYDNTSRDLSTPVTDLSTKAKSTNQNTQTHSIQSVSPKTPRRRLSEYDNTSRDVSTPVTDLSTKAKSTNQPSVTPPPLSNIMTSNLSNKASESFGLLKSNADVTNKIKPRNEVSFSVSKLTGNETPADENLNDINKTQIVEVKKYQEQDLETAKKIAMLPKELVDILGNMPAAHRNQLLNILPQYVSATHLANIKDDVLEETSAVPHLASNTQHLEQTHDVQMLTQPSHLLNQKMTGQIIMDNESPTPYSMPQQSQLILHNLNEDIKPVEKYLDPCIKLENEDKGIDLDPCVKVIDLTEEDVCANNDAIKISEDIPSAPSLPSQDIISNLVTVEKPSIVKKSNDQTASLRAVRIKTPSERNKNHMANAMMTDKVTLQSLVSENDSDNNEVNKSINISISLESVASLAIQQSEISSTQHNNKKILIDSLSPPIVSSNRNSDSESSEKNVGINAQPLTTDPVKTIQNDTVHEIHKTNATKSTLVTSSIAAHKPTANECSLSNTNQIKNCVVKNESNLAEKSAEIDIQDTTIVHEIVDKCTVPENPLLDEGKVVSHKTDQDDDSEDDISLAAIVLQKQRGDLQKKLDTDTEIVTQEPPRSLTIRKRKKQKKPKKTNKNMLLEKDIDITIIETNMDTVKQQNVAINKSDGVENASTEIIKLDAGSASTMNDNHPKKNVKKQIGSLDLQIQTIAEPQSESTENETEMVLKKKFNTPMEKLSQIKHDQYSVTHRNPEDNSEGNDVSNKTTTMKENVETNNIQKEKPTVDINYDYKSNRENDVFKKKKQSDNRHELFDISEKIITSQIKDDLIHDTAAATTESLELEVPSTAITANEQDKKIIKHIQLSTDVTQESDTTDHVISCNISDDSSFTPLRRSKRGKSLFIENESTEYEISITNEFSSNNKGPITKKQLILSKLLLDEDLQNKSLNLASDNIIVSSDQDIESHTELQQKTVNETESKVLVKKCKPTKRKKSPQIKRKTKKKKSLEMSEIELISEITQKDSGEPCSASNKTKIPLESEDIMISQKSTAEVETLTSDQKCKSEVDSHYIPKEKRKISNDTSTSDNAQCSKAKKSKILSKELVESDNDDVKNKCDDTSTDITPNTSLGIRATCYNMPVAARRTRSKSFVGKGSLETLQYDPYDIDLDDMDFKNEPFRQKITKSKDDVLEITTPPVVNTVVESEEVNAGEILKARVPLTIVKDSCKMEIDPTTELNSQTAVNETEKLDTKIRKFKKTSKKAKSAGAKQRKLMKNKLKGSILVKRSAKKNTMDISDSDDSSKSDIPLKKYAKKRGKIHSEITIIVEKVRIDTDYPKPNLCERHQQNNCPELNETSKPSTSHAEDKEMINDKFMENFGFFSERKPRKSNLLATKKISETFHIIANESDEEKSRKRSTATERRKSSDGLVECCGFHICVKRTRRGRKKRNGDDDDDDKCYCELCRKEFRRPDNYLRHQLTLLHVARIAEVELRIKTTPMIEEPNYLIVYKQQIDRLRMLMKKLAKRKKSKCKVKVPTMEEILETVRRTVRTQQLKQRGLSNDEALFLDCCELLQEGPKPDRAKIETVQLEDVNNVACSSSTAPEIVVEKCDSKSDGDVDSITARNILESEEVRNLENDLISGLKEAAKAKQAEYQQTEPVVIDSNEECIVKFSSPSVDTNFDHTEESNMFEETTTISKKQPEYKEKMYPDLDNIDIFEDKFDKIKRKCRSQAAAAKHTQSVADRCSNLKIRKKLDKKKIKKLKKNSQSTVLTKGALKGFDGIRVSIPTTDINIAAIVPQVDMPSKKKKKTNSKKKRDKKVSEKISERPKESYQKKLDVYEFMDNEEAELFEFRPSTLMERFKSITSKENKIRENVKVSDVPDNIDNLSENGSDGDDFVYMSDYMGSDNETESSLMSEVGNKIDAKKSATLKKKDAVEKNAVMGKIFKHNAVRAEKKLTKTNEPVEPKANLDQLFDSLLEDEPSSSMLHDDTLPKKDDFGYSTNLTTPQKDALPEEHDDSLLKRSPTFSPPPYDSSTPSSGIHRYRKTATNKFEDEYVIDFGPSTSKKADELYASMTKKMFSADSKNENSNELSDLRSVSDDYKTASMKNKLLKEKSPPRELEESYDFNADFEDFNADDTGVARQRARRKCTVGKQNVLAETWSSESELDGAPHRPNSTESVVASSARKKKGKKKDGQHSARRNSKNIGKKQDVDSRVNNGNRNGTGSCGDGRGSGLVDGAEHVDKAESSGAEFPPPGVPPASSCTGAAGKPRPRPATYYWSSEGDEEPEHVQQHGWIVGDSHKKLVTMLAHAKGRKRNNDEKRHLIE